MPGWVRYIFGCAADFELGGEPRRFATCWRVEGNLEVRARMSVRRFEDLYAEGADRPWMSAGLKVEA